MRFRMPFALLAVLGVAFPFLFPYTQPPSTNFWPLMAAGLCGGLIAVAWNARSPSGLQTGKDVWPDRSEMATWLSAGLLLAALLASAIGLLQYFGAATGLDPWVHASKPGQAMGNLRQRNQQATLLSMGLWALLWVVAQTEAHLKQAANRSASTSNFQDARAAMDIPLPPSMCRISLSENSRSCTRRRHTFFFREVLGHSMNFSNL
ncbi:MAG: hypothetical protein A2Z55_04705 [Burkholderiales bacterium RIFCSPHIGHO2_12_63_9]|nr:MAG: hypothetical protein A2Z55_04705 [Burkholderiales bacterium RIFCSPHIGHO2_12_63_9]